MRPNLRMIHDDASHSTPHKCSDSSFVAISPGHAMRRPSYRTLTRNLYCIGDASNTPRFRLLMMRPLYWVFSLAPFRCLDKCNKLPIVHDIRVRARRVLDTGLDTRKEVGRVSSSSLTACIKAAWRKPSISPSSSHLPPLSPS